MWLSHCSLSAPCRYCCCRIDFIFIVLDEGTWCNLVSQVADKCSRWPWWAHPMAQRGTNRPTGIFPLGLVLLFAAYPLWELTFQAKALCSTLCKALFIECVHATLFSLLLFTFFHLPPGFILALGKACLQIDVKLMKILCPGCGPSSLVFASAAINAFLHLFQPLPSLSWQLNWKPTAILLSQSFAWGTNNRLKLTQIMILIGLIFAIGFRKKSYFSPSSSLISFINPSMVLKTSKTFSTER